MRDFWVPVLRAFFWQFKHIHAWQFDILPDHHLSCPVCGGTTYRKETQS